MYRMDSFQLFIISFKMVVLFSKFLPGKKDTLLGLLLDYEFYTYSRKKEKDTSFVSRHCLEDGGAPRADH